MARSSRYSWGCCQAMRTELHLPGKVRCRVNSGCGVALQESRKALLGGDGVSGLSHGRC